MSRDMPPAPCTGGPAPRCRIVPGDPVGDVADVSKRTDPPAYRVARGVRSHNLPASGARRSFDTPNIRSRNGTGVPAPGLHGLNGFRPSRNGAGATFGAMPQDLRRGWDDCLRLTRRRHPGCRGDCFHAHHATSSASTRTALRPSRAWPGRPSSPDSRVRSDASFVSLRSSIGIPQRGLSAKTPRLHQIAPIGAKFRRKARR